MGKRWRGYILTVLVGSALAGAALLGLVYWGTDRCWPMAGFGALLGCLSAVLQLLGDWFRGEFR